jgi:hypothetical protein
MLNIANPKFSQAVFDYARQSFRDEVAELLDDPFALLHPDNPESPETYFRRQRTLASELGIDFDALVAELGTAFECKRLRMIETGKVGKSRATALGAAQHTNVPTRKTPARSVR